MTSRLTRFALLTVIACCSAAWSPADEPTKGEKPAAGSMPGKKAGDVREDNGLSMKLVWCSRGLFTMENKPAANDIPRTVFFSEGYWLGRCEVTQSEWLRVMETEPWKGRNRTRIGDDFPASWVDWNEAMEFCRKLTKRERLAGRIPSNWEYTLPTEAQWYRACRAGTETQYSFGDDESKLGEYAWFGDNTRDAGEDYAHRVGRKKPNPWGLYNMHGNVAEWCRDYFSDDLPGGIDAERMEMNEERVLKGDGWRYTAQGCRSTSRRGCDPANRFSDIGFRVVLTVVRVEK